MTSCIPQALTLTTTISSGWQTLTQDDSSTSDTTTIDASPQKNTKKKTSRGKMLAPICSMAVSIETHRETSVQFHVLNPTLTLSTSVRLSGTWQLPVSGSKRACVYLVHIHIFASRLLFALAPAHARPNAVPNSLNLHYTARLENVPSLLRRDKNMSRMPQNASEMRNKPQAERWTDKESSKTLIDN